MLCRMPDCELQKLNLPVPLMTAIRVWRVQQSNNIRGRKVGREGGKERGREGERKGGREGEREGGREGGREEERESERGRE